MSIRLADIVYIAGTWAGSGHVEYPTIDPSDYREELTFSFDGKHQALQYAQKTWKVVPDSMKMDPLFRDSGFLIEKEDGIFELASAQQGGRLELLRGSARMEHNGSVVLDLKSVSIINDLRMVESRRIFRIHPDKLSYELLMSTTANPTLQLHASCHLTKCK